MQIRTMARWVSSNELFKKQYLMHLDDGKGNHCKTADQTKEDILEEINLPAAVDPHTLQRGKVRDGSKWLSQSFETQVKQSKEDGYAISISFGSCKAASASSLQSGSIAAINNMTSPAKHFLHFQLNEAV